MKSKCSLLAVVALAVVMSASDASAYNRYGYRRGGSGYGGGFAGAGSTVYGSAMLGQAAYAQSLGMYQVMNAQANIYNQQAFSAYLQNRRNYAQTYFDLKRLHESWVAEQNAKHPPATREQLEAISKLGLPKRLGSEDYDPSTAIINWPEILKGSKFDDDRKHLEELFAARAGMASGLGTDNYHEIRSIAAGMQDRLQGMVKDMTPDEYIQGHRFISSLAYEGRFSQSSENVAVK